MKPLLRGLIPLLALGLPVVPALAAPAADLRAIPLQTITGEPTSLQAYAGKVVLVVNTASACGLTPQYKGLEALYRKHQAEGLVVLGFPCNDFGGQEPGTREEIQAFCSGRFEVSFPLMDKVKVKPGEGQHPLYAALTGPEAAFPGPVKWNFGKFLIGRDGKVQARFEPRVAPDAAELTAAVAAALSAP
jgi:glutathione peroxidase